MKRSFFFLLGTVMAASAFAQDADHVVTINTNAVKPVTDFTVEKNNPATPVKNQGNTGTCWSFSTTSMVESQLEKSNAGIYDLSEMYTARSIYVEKAKNYISRQGHTQFGEGGLGHDAIRAIDRYGAIPETVYSGLQPSQKMHDHSKLAKELKDFLDNVLKTTPVDPNWMEGYSKILDNYLGTVPDKFEYNGKSYSPLTFAKEAMKFNAADYVNLTSFSDHPYYKSYILNIPDNFSNGAFYNLPLNELISVTESAIRNGYTVLWDADVSNNGFRMKKGFALNLDQTKKYPDSTLSISSTEEKWDEATRQKLFDNLTTQDDHLMHITGIERSRDGKTFFIVKNSWGAIGPYKGYINVSEGYFAINTISLVIPKAAMSKALLEKLK